MDDKLPIVGLMGRAGAGKDTVANMGVQLLDEVGVRARSIALADPLKAACMSIFGVAYNLPPAVFYGDQPQKNAPLEIPFGWTGRGILQHIGTEGFRHVDPNIWANHMLSRVRILVRDDHKVVFISDVRFASEVAAIRDNGGTVVRVARPSVDNASGNQGIAGHQSEIEMSSLQADYVINNQDRPLEDLRVLVKKLLCDLRFLDSM